MNRPAYALSIAALASVFALAGCGGGGNEPAPASPEMTKVVEKTPEGTKGPNNETKEADGPVGGQAGHTTKPAPSATAPTGPATGACADYVGSWKAAIQSGATIEIAALGGTKPLGGEIDFKLTEATPDTANFDGSLTVMVMGLPPITAPLSGLTIKCDGALTVDATQMFPMIGSVHFKVDGTLEKGKKPMAGSGTFDVQTPTGAPIQFHASGKIDLTQG
jgi:hypothetical protein